MSAVESEKAEIAALAAKLSSARTEIQAKDKEINDLRNRVVALEDKSPVGYLKAENAALGSELKDTSAKLVDTEKQLAKALRDVAAAGPALALADAVNAIKA